MLADPAKVVHNVWFIPESGIDQPPSIVGSAIGYLDAWKIATEFINKDFQEPAHYGQMYADARALLARWLIDPYKWSVSLPVHYGTLVVCG